MEKDYSIPPDVWLQLVEAKARAKNWAKHGVFATAEGRNYERGGAGSLFYVGKCAGKGVKNLTPPLGNDQKISTTATEKWLHDAAYKVFYWDFLRDITTTDQIAWSNVCKMDREDGENPEPDEFGLVADECIVALKKEIEDLKPHVLLLAIGHAFKDRIPPLLNVLKYRSCNPPSGSRFIQYFENGGRFAVIHRHPASYRKPKGKKPVEWLDGVKAIRELLAKKLT